MTLKEKDIRIIRGVGQVAALFTLVVSMTMIFSLIQLKSVNPLDSPTLLSLKEQIDRDPGNMNIAGQIRAMDLMARKAYFSSRWQVETGSYLLLAGAIIFIFCQRIIAGNDRLNPDQPGEKRDSWRQNNSIRRLLLILASVIASAAIISSFILRNNLPGTLSGKNELSGSAGISTTDTPKTTKPEPGNFESSSEDFKPDKTNFPFFRGQDSRGIAGGSGYPTEWNGEKGQNITWKTKIEVSGKSSPVIWTNKIFITGADGLKCLVYCIDKQSGSILWTASASGLPGEPAAFPKMSVDAGLAVSTIATNGKVVCAIFANGNLICLDLEGKTRWAKNIGSPVSSYGYTSSLILYKEILLVQYDDNNKVSLLGFDTSNGDLKWETLREGRAVWSSPVIANFEGVPQVIINGNPYVSAYDPVTGNQLWKIECLTGDVAPSVAVNSTLVFAVTDFARLAAIKPGKASSILWEDNTFTPDVSSPAATDKFLFLSTGNGDVACYNAQKGDTLWSHYFPEPFYASPVICDGKVYFLDRKGVMHIIKAESAYHLVTESPLGERTDCTPAFSDGRIFIRGQYNIYCISDN